MIEHPQVNSTTAPTDGTVSARSYPPAINKAAVVLGRWGFTPNTLTYASLIPAIACGFAAAAGFFLIAVACLIVSGICDLLDGSLARATNSTTAYGALLDATVDRLSDAAPLLGLTVFFAPNGWLVIIPGLTLLGAYTISYIRARAEALGAKLPWRTMRRGDRLIIISIVLLLGEIHLPGVDVPAPLTLLGVGFAGLLNMLTCVTVLSTARNLFRSGSHRNS
jgi:CDP-diacylglycerol---glycerol-3-phosphate 3-phosphatidyltransferase